MRHHVINSPIWGEARPQFAPLSDKHNVDVVVVGLGAAGLTAVVDAARRGLKVIGIDSKCVGAGAAGRNGGFLMAGLAIPYDEAITYLGHRRAQAWYSATEDELRRCLANFPDNVVQSGSLRLATAEGELEMVRREYEARLADDFPVFWYDGLEGQGYIATTDSMYNPLQRCQSLADEAVRLGARLYEQTPALEVADRSVRTPNGEIHARAVIVAVDGWLENVLPELQGRVRSTRLQMLATKPLSKQIVRYPTYMRRGYDYCLQLPTGEIALGGLRDAHYDLEWGAPAEPAAPIQDGLEQLIKKITAGKAKISHRWAGVVSYTDDHLPICEQVQPGVFAIGAYSGLGNVISTLCGRAVVSHLFGESHLFDVFRSDNHVSESSALSA